MAENPTAFKDFLKAEMKARDWEQVDLIRETKAGKATVSRWLDEVNPTIPDLKHFMVLSKVLHISIETLLAYPYPGEFYGSTLSADSRLLAERFDQFPEGVRKAILAIMRDALK